MLRIDEADLYYEVRGSGPALLMIPGAGGDAGYYAEVAKELSDAFTVITYDRRGNSRSGGRTASGTSMARQSRDAYEIIRQLAGGRALVFGNSGGAIIGLDLAARHPECILGLVAHEPPIIRILPDRDRWIEFFDQVSDLAHSASLQAAVERFIATIVGEGTYEWPSSVSERFAGNLEYLFTREMHAFVSFEPDVSALSRCTFPLVLAAGAGDRGCYYARPSHVLAEQLGVPWAEFPGYHLAFMERPAAFAAALRSLLSSMSSQLGLVPLEWKLGEVC